MKGRGFVTNEVRNINFLHIQDMQFIQDGHDSKVNERCYEVEREYLVMKVKKCDRFPKLLLKSHMVSVCE